MTEDEAKDTRCCGPDDCGVRRDTTKERAFPTRSVERYCAASNCMGWRWLPTKPFRGFCGLAGKL